MSRHFVVFLRGISNVPMQPFRDGLLGIGMTDVVSFGGTGNLIFSGDGSDRAALERQIGDAVRAEAFVRTRDELGAVVANDPFAGRTGASVMFMHGPVDATQEAALMADGFEREPPVISGAQVYFLHPLRRRGRRSTVDLERELATRGTMRASHVVARIFELM